MSLSFVMKLVRLIVLKLTELEHAMGYGHPALKSERKWLISKKSNMPSV